MHTMAFGLKGIDDLVLEGCLENQAYDPHCEDDRAPWLYRMFKGSAHYNKFSNAILAMLDNDVEHRSMEQFCDLAGLMACDGDGNAATSLRNFVWGQDFKADTQFGTRALVMLDGVQAVVELARRLGRILMSDSEEMVDDLDCLTEDANCYDEALASLKQLATEEEAIAAYLQMHLQGIASKESEEEKSRELQQDEARERVRKDYPIEKILAAAESGESSRPYFFATFGRWATKSELDIVLRHMIAATVPEVCLRLLWVFRTAVLPTLHPRIWALAEDRDERLRHAALKALAQVCDEKIGEYGRKKLRTGFPVTDSEVIELFGKNYHLGDEVLIMSALEKLSPSEDDAHSLGLSALKIWHHDDSPELRGLAEWTYRTTPCSFCRSIAVKWLVEISSLPAEIANECLYDADRDTQAIAREALAAQLG